MKTNKYLNIAASVLMLAACAKEELVPSEELIPVSESTTVTFVATDGTKTVLGGDLKTTSWDKKENVLLWEGETSLIISDDDKSYSEDGKKLTIIKEVASPESTFYSIIGPEGEDNVTRTSATVLDTQNPKPTSFDPNAEILVAQPATCGEGNTVALRYNRPVAITVATLKNLEADEKVLSVKITANENLTGKVNFTYEGSSVKAAMVGTGNTITCNYTTNNTVVKGEKDEDGYIFPVYFISLNADVMGFEFEVCTDKHKYYRKITRPEGSPIILNDNRVAQFGFKLENADKADAEGDKFVKVTEEPDDWSGEYLLVYESGDNKALCWTGVDAVSCNVVADVANGEIAAKPDGAVTLTIASIEKGYSIKVNGGDNNGKYIGQNSYANGINILEGSQLNTIEIAESSAKISGIGSSGDSHVALRYNKASDQKRFRYYKSDQEAVQLYKKEAGGYGKYTLATPKNIQYSAETQKITWDAVENAGKYTISLNGGESVECPSNEYDASTLAAEYYYATVVAYPSAEKESTYQASSAGTNEGWFKIGEPTMKKIEAKDIDVLAGARSLEITWPEQTLATNGYSSELWSVGEDREKLQEKTEIAPDATSITYDKLEPDTKYRVYLTVKGVTLNDDRGERVYGDCTTYKDPRTAQLFTIAEITKAGSYAIENAVVVAKANDGFLVKDNIDEDAGYIMVNKAADDLIVGDIVSVSGTVESSNSQWRFGELSNYSKTGHNDSFVQPATADKYTGVFEYLKYVNIIGNMTSSSGWLVTDATGNKLKVLDNDKTGANKYVSVTGYLTHTTASFAYLIATEIVEHTLTATPEELTWEASATGQKSITITSDNANWNFAPTDNSEWNISKNGNTLSVRPVSANASINKKELTVTLTHATNTQLTKEIKLSQDGKEASYEKVTNVNDLSDGDVIVLAYESGNKAAGPMGDKDYFSSVDATINNGVLTSSGAIPITLGKDGNWTLSISGSKVGATKAKSLSTTGGTTTWTISIADNGDATITSTTDGYGSFLYNVSSPRFLNYTSNPTATMCRPQIYKLQKTITSIEVSGSPTKTTYTAGERFDPTGLTVTGTYDDGTTAPLTNVKWEITPSPLTVGITSVSVVAKKGDVTSNTYQVSGLTVNAVQTYSITEYSSAQGSVTANVSTSQAGATITLTITPESPNILKSIKVHKDGEESTTVELSGSGNTRTFTMPAYDVVVSAEFGQGGGTPHTYTMTIDSSNNGSNNVHWTGSSVTSLTYDNVTWLTSVTGTTSFTSSTTYCQIGSKNNPATKVSLTTSAFAGKTITSVKVTCYCASNTGPTLTVTAGSITMINKAALIKGTSTEMSSTDGTSATLGATDNLSIVFDSSAKAAIYISKIEVNYTD